MDGSGAKRRKLFGKCPRMSRFFWGGPDPPPLWVTWHCGSWRWTEHPPMVKEIRWMAVDRQDQVRKLRNDLEKCVQIEPDPWELDLCNSSVQGSAGLRERNLFPMSFIQPSLVAHSAFLCNFGNPQSIKDSILSQACRVAGDVAFGSGFS